MAAPLTDALLAVEGLSVASAAGEIVRGADLTLAPGEVLGLLGESGCGKTTLGLAVLGLLDRGRAVTAGAVRLRGEVVVAASVDRMPGLRGEVFGFVPQDPFSAFDPLRRVGSQIARALLLHRPLSRAAAEVQVLELLAALGVPDPRAVTRRFPHELSGGMRQRAVIAAALACEPAVVVADEPTTALDVLVQAQVLEAFLRLTRDLGAALLLITHDIGVLAGVADRVAAMYAGRIVEFGPTASVLTAPHHHYVRALLDAVPSIAGNKPISGVPGQPPSLPGPLEPCAFAPRCPRADEVCRTIVPEYAWPAEAGSACHHPLTPAIP